MLLCDAFIGSDLNAIWTWTITVTCWPELLRLFLLDAQAHLQCALEGATLLTHSQKNSLDLAYLMRSLKLSWVSCSQVIPVQNPGFLPSTLSFERPRCSEKFLCASTFGISWLTAGSCSPKSGITFLSRTRFLADLVALAGSGKSFSPIWAYIRHRLTEILPFDAKVLHLPVACSCRWPHQEHRLLR